MIKKMLYGIGMLPSQYTWPNPFKILEYNELLKDCDFKKTDRVLDFGCGGGRQSVLLAKKVGKVVGVDIDGLEIERAKAYAQYTQTQNVEFIHAAVEKVCFPSESFDVVVSFCVMEHVPNYRAVCDEFYRLLKPGGKMLLSVDALETVTDPEILNLHTKEGGVVQYFRSGPLQELIRTVGMEQIQIRPIFRSDYARVRFESGIRNRWAGYRVLKKFLEYGRLLWEEALSKNSAKGIFLCLSATKPKRSL